ncbi:MAG TPA: acyl-CoA carboxylase epsilon subunit [Actinospica sp.]|nr:acyl-CoA carboxylase epsilon subunit [Actinospica sp.]
MSIRTLDGFEVRGNPTDEELLAAVTALLASFAAAERARRRPTGPRWRGRPAALPPDRGPDGWRHSTWT